MMAVLIAILIVVCGFLYAKFDYHTDHARFLRGLNGWFVFMLSVGVAIGIVVGSLL